MYNLPCMCEVLGLVSNTEGQKKWVFFFSGLRDPENVCEHMRCTFSRNKVFIGALHVSL